MRAARRVLAPVLLCIVAAAAWPAAAQCPQPRTTSNAPAEFYDRASPLAPNADTRAAEREYQVGGKHFHGCALCHGTKADGEGELSERFDPPPRNFRCRQTMSGIPDGQ